MPQLRLQRLWCWLSSRLGTSHEHLQMLSSDLRYQVVELQVYVLRVHLEKRVLCNCTSLICIAFMHMLLECNHIVLQIMILARYPYKIRLKI